MDGRRNGTDEAPALEHTFGLWSFGRSVVPYVRHHPAWRHHHHLRCPSTVVRREDNENLALSKRRRELVVPAHPWVVGVYAAYCVERDRVPAARLSDFVFVNLRGGELGRARRDGRAREVVGALGRRAGIERVVTPHQFRHGLATEMVESGRSLDEVQMILGHAQVEATHRYAHTSRRSEYRRGCVPSWVVLARCSATRITSHTGTYQPWWGLSSPSCSRTSSFRTQPRGELGLRPGRRAKRRPGFGPQLAGTISLSNRPGLEFGVSSANGHMICRWTQRRPPSSEQSSAPRSRSGRSLSDTTSRSGAIVDRRGASRLGRSLLRPLRLSTSRRR
jgi:hypothetical protein